MSFHSFLLNFIAKSSTDINKLMIQGMTWRRPGDDPLHGSMMAGVVFNDGYMHHPTSLCWFGLAAPQLSGHG